MPDFVTGSGAPVMMNAAPFKDAMALKNAIEKEIIASGLKIDLTSLMTDFSAFTNAMLAVDSSDVVFAALMKCMIRGTYNHEKITEATFENERAREDYYEIVAECLRVNLSPFIKGLLSKLKIFESKQPIKSPLQNPPTSK